MDLIFMGICVVLKSLKKNCQMKKYFLIPLRVKNYSHEHFLKVWDNKRDEILAQLVLKM